MRFSLVRAMATKGLSVDKISGSSEKKKIRKEKKEPGLLNLGRYSVSEWMVCNILEDRLWPSDEKDLLKIFGKFSRIIC